MKTICLQLDGASKSGRISGFNDPGIADGKIIIDLVDAVRPGSVNYSVVKSGKTDEVSLPMMTMNDDYHICMMTTIVRR